MFTHSFEIIALNQSTVKHHADLESQDQCSVSMHIYNTFSGKHFTGMDKTCLDTSSWEFICEGLQTAWHNRTSTYVIT